MKKDRIKLIIAITVLAIAGVVIAVQYWPSGGGAANSGSTTTSDQAGGNPAPAPPPTDLAPGVKDAPIPERPRGSGKRPAGG